LTLWCKKEVAQSGDQRLTATITKERDLTFQFVRDAVARPVKMIVNENGAKADELIFIK